MKEYIKLFNNLQSADGYVIEDIPFLSAVKSEDSGDTMQNVRCTEEGKKIQVSGDSIDVVDNVSLITFTVVWNHESPGHDAPSHTNYTEQAELGMRLSDFIDSDYNPIQYGAKKYCHNYPWTWGGTYGFADETVVIVDGGTYQFNDYYTCLLGDTEVTMSDGSIKLIKDIIVGDEVLSLDLTTGERVSRKVIFTDAAENKSANVWDEWEFSDGSVIKTTYRHEFYNIESGKFKYLDEWQIGAHTYKLDGTTPALVKHVVHKEIVNHYKITLENSNNYFANGLLTGDRYCNELNTNLK